MKRRPLRPLWIACFALALLTSAGFGLKALWSIWEFAERAERPVAGWMTPRYLVAVYDLDPDALATILSLPRGADPRESIATLALTAGRDPAAVISEIETLIAETRAGK